MNKEKINPVNRLLVMKQYIYELLLLITYISIVKLSNFFYISIILGGIGFVLSAFILNRYVKWFRYCMKNKVYPYPYKFTIREERIIRNNKATLLAIFIYLGAILIWIFVSIVTLKYFVINKILII